MRERKVEGSGREGTSLLKVLLFLRDDIRAVVDYRGIRSQHALSVWSICWPLGADKAVGREWFAVDLMPPAHPNKEPIF